MAWVESGLVSRRASMRGRASLLIECDGAAGVAAEAAVRAGDAVEVGVEGLDVGRVAEAR